MPAAPRAAPAAPPTSSCCRVSFMALRVLRCDADEPADDAVEVGDYLSVSERFRDVLADRVQAAVRPPRVEDVPLVDAAVHGVDRCRDQAETTLPVRVAEARHRRRAGLAVHDLDVLTARDPRATREAAEVDVHVLARWLVPEEADEVASVLLDVDAVGPVAAHLPVERARHPRRAVDGSVDAIGEP